MKDSPHNAQHLYSGGGLFRHSAVGLGERIRISPMLRLSMGLRDPLSRIFWPPAERVVEEVGSGSFSNVGPTCTPLNSTSVSVFLVLISEENTEVTARSDYKASK